MGYRGFISPVSNHLANPMAHLSNANAFPLLHTSRPQIAGWRSCTVNRETPPHPHQACCIQTCTQGQRSCLLCHMPSEGRLTNKSQPARSKQVQPAQPARHKTSPQHSNRKSKSNCWRPCAPRQFLFIGRKVLVSIFLEETFYEDELI